MPPVADDCIRKEDDDWDGDELECECDDEEDTQEEEEVVGGGRTNDSAIHRSPSPSSSICHSLEWDSDDFCMGRGGHPMQHQSLHHYGRLLGPS